MQINLNEGWYFYKGDIKLDKALAKRGIEGKSKTEKKKAGPASYDYKEYAADNGIWLLVDIPHDYVIDQDLSNEEAWETGHFKYDNAWYRKHFTLPENCEDKRITLRFDGIAGKSTIYLNGCLMKHNYSSYNTFEIDISDYVFFDKENVVAIYIDREDTEGWWYQGGGIYRKVHLNITEPIAIDLWGVYAPYKKINDSDFEINFETTVLNTSYQDAEIEIESFVLDKDKNVAAKAYGSGYVKLRDKSTIKYQSVIKNPLLWDCENPNLYTIKTNLMMKGKVIDENITRTGFRTIEISEENGFLLNGNKTIIKGVCSHQDFGLTGIAVPDNVAKYKISLIKQMGANGYRTSHYMQTEAYMDALDEMGFLVMDENRWFMSNDETLEQVEALVKRDRNRPSVIFWSTSNEEMFHEQDRGRRIHKAIAEHIRKFDDTRFILGAVNLPTTAKIYDDCDVIGINYNIHFYEDVHEKYPNKLIISSECCATGSVRDWNFATNDRGRMKNKDVISHEQYQSREITWKFLTSKPYVIGCYQWDAFEHRGEALWPRMCSVAGAIDIFTQKKGAFYQNKSMWTEEPMAHIVPHWNFKGLEGEEIYVAVYTNCDELELYLNGKSLGKQEIEKYGHGKWNVQYEAGELIAVGYNKGKKVCEDKRITTGKPVSLKLSLLNDFEANNHDLALFTCECLDENGNIVPDAEEFVEFSVSSPAKLIGTGSDNTDPISVGCASRKMYMGKILVAIRPSQDEPYFELVAKSKDCGITIYKNLK